MTYAAPALDADLATVLAALDGAPRCFAAAIAAIPLAELGWKPGPRADDFAGIEHIAHLRDLEIEGYALRIRRTVDEDRPSLPDIDGTRLATERRYLADDIGAALAAFAAARRGNVAWLRRLDPAAFEREAEWQGVGRVNLDYIVRAMAAHDAGHLADLDALRLALRQRNAGG